MRPITMTSSVAAIVPHFACERWLASCLESLLEQTRALDAIIVLDDASQQPPTAIVERYPSVTLLRAERNVGPYRLVQQAIEDFPFDAYLFQDADDWSAPMRLERLLAVAEREGAHLVGSHEVRILVDEGDVLRVRYPNDVNAALREHPQGFPLLHPTSIISRSLVELLGGFASGMRFSGDAELLRRAGHVGRIVNVPEYLYFRRKRSGALTTSPDTGLGAPAREAVQRELRERALRNAELARRGEEPDLAPMSVAPPVALERLCGPEPTVALAGRHAPRVPHRREHVPPLFIVGPPRSGVELLAWCLAQSDGVYPVFDGGWIASLLRDTLEGIDALHEEPGASLDPHRDAALAEAGRTVERLLEHRALVAPRSAGESGFRFVVASPELALDLPALVRAFPGCRFVAISRSREAVETAMRDGTPVDGAHLSPQATAERWSRIATAVADARDALGERLLEVAYADLLTAPDATLGRVLEHAGLEVDRRAARPLVDMRPTPADHQAVESAARRADAERTETSPGVVAASRNGPGESDATIDVRDLWWRRYVELDLVAEGPRASLADRLRAAVQRLVPEGSTVAVISRGDEELLRLGRRRGLHLPADASGAYAGYHPADGAAALAQLEGAIGAGARYLAIPSTSLWWLDHYSELAVALEDRHQLLMLDPDLGALYALDPAASPTTTRSHDSSDELARLAATGDATCAAVADALRDVAGSVIDDDERAWIERIEALRDRLERSDETISIALPSKRRVEKHDTVGAICRLRSKRPLWGYVLMELVRHLRPEHAIELGTCMGMSTAYQVAGLEMNGRGELVSLEGAPALADLAASNLASIGGRRARVVQGLFVDTLDGVLEELPRIDFAFIDGHHDEHATLRYFEAMLPKASPGSLFAFDDIRWSEGMERAWHALCAHGAVTASIDLGTIGLCIVGGPHRHGHFAPGEPAPRRVTDERLSVELGSHFDASSRVLVVSRGDDELLELIGPRAAHFPHGRDGRWIGYHPADSAEALSLLADAIGEGATHLLIPAEAAWWLEFYKELARRLRTEHELVAETSEYRLYRLHPTTPHGVLHTALDEDHR